MIPIVFAGFSISAAQHTKKIILFLKHWKSKPLSELNRIQYNSDVGKNSLTGTHRMSKKSKKAKNNDAESSTVIVCDESMDIRGVGEMKKIFDAAMASKKPVTLQAKNVERADTAGLQLCCAFFKDARAGGIDIGWEQPSDTLKKSAGLLGLTEALEL